MIIKIDLIELNTQPSKSSNASPCKVMGASVTLRRKAISLGVSESGRDLAVMAQAAPGRSRAGGNLYLPSSPRTLPTRARSRRRRRRSKQNMVWAGRGVSCLHGYLHAHAFDLLVLLTIMQETNANAIAKLRDQSMKFLDGMYRLIRK